MSISSDIKIINSFKQEVLEKGIGQVTIGSVADRCGCARQTIYYHFRGTQDILKWIITNEQDYCMYDPLEKNHWKNEMFNILSNLKKDGWIFQQIFDSKINATFNELLLDIIHSRVVQAFLLSCGDDGTSKSRESISRILTYGFTGPTVEWIKRGYPESPAELMEDYNRLCGSAMHNVVKDFLILRPQGKSSC